MPLLENFSNFTIYSTEQYDQIISELEKQLKLLHSATLEYSTKVALFEAVNNSLEHGKLPVTIQFETKDHEVQINVKDSGEGFQVSQKVNLIAEKGIEVLLEESIFSERGRGIYMMYKLVNQVIFNEKGNEVSLVINTH
ncbi:anti-sigma regulatory factor (Ser/Thr protein kinase) [Bacillus mesophilus]|uniref:ATP-binding protein n=1 Tax=Bacillus mesophilus TaxID=1808955 RepID=A0A6M0Q709_9BACI|nr:ATP-binding protein [Bacillus mesophilus]MBM7660027.1 anti-sigma regulatory factor (Ser/Thr protein kinase) [Bacillus mesophilus]NEY70888.1 ATP-binding protein [Bacillus mesophilus]